MKTFYTPTPIHVHKNTDATPPIEERSPPLYKETGDFSELPT